MRSTGQSTRQLVEAASRSASDAVVEPGEELQARVKPVSVGEAFLDSEEGLTMQTKPNGICMRTQQPAKSIQGERQSHGTRGTRANPQHSKARTHQ